MSLSAAIERITSAPATVMGINAGHLSLGAVADVCVFDADAYYQVAAKTLKSQGKNTPFLGMELAGKVRYTLVAGQLVYQGD